MKTKQDKPLDWRADAFGGGILKSAKEVARWKTHPEKIMSDFAAGSEDDDPAGMSILPGDSIEFVIETHCLGQGMNGGVGSRQEVPTGRAPDASIALEISLLLGGCEGGPLLGIDARVNQDEHVLDAPHPVLHRFSQAVQHDRAKHWTAVIAGDQDDRFVAKIVAEAH